MAIGRPPSPAPTSATRLVTTSISWVTVSNGVLHGVYGSPGQPVSLQIDGNIGPDGQSRLLAQGHTGAKEFVPGRDTPRGTPYSYFVDAHFSASFGNGTRVEGRPCTIQFARQ